MDDPQVQAADKPPLLTTIREQFLDQDREALKAINHYLEVYPDDEDAQLLRAEMILVWRHIRDYRIAAEILHNTSFHETYPTEIARLQTLVPSIVADLLAKGQSDIEDNDLGDAIAHFDRAVLLMPEDAAVAFACGKALAASEFSNSGHRRLITRTRVDWDYWYDKVNTHLRSALDLSTPGRPPYDAAALQMVQYQLKVKSLKAEALQYLLKLTNRDAEIEAVWDAAVQHVGDKACTMAVHLLKMGDLYRASRLLNLMKQMNADQPQLPFLVAEKHRQRSQWEAALKAYRRVDKPPTGKASHYPSLVKLQKRLEKLTVTCAACGKRVAPGPKCPLCQHDFVQHDLLTERMPVENWQALAYLGSVEVYMEMGQQEAALSHLDQAEALLPAASVLQNEIRRLRLELMPQPEQIDPMTRVISQLREAGMSESVRYWIKQLMEQPYEVWEPVPAGTRLMICRALLNYGDLVGAQSLLQIALPDKTHLKSVQAFQQELEQRIQDEVAQVLAQARTVAAEGHLERVVQLASKALKLVPSHFETLLLRGQARAKLQHDAPALDDLYQALRLAENEAQRVAVQRSIAMLLERRWDFDGTEAILEQLPDDETTHKMKVRLERRRQAIPYIRIEKANTVLTDDTLMQVPVSEGFNAFFAVIVREVSSPNNFSKQWNDHLLNAGFEFTQILGTFRDMAVDPVFSLRFICHPAPENPEQGRMTVALLVRVHGQDAAKCNEQALQVYRDVMASLPLVQESIYIVEPVVEESELAQLRTPFEAAHMSEVVRRESDPVLDGLYTVTPFTPGTFDMHNLFWTLLRQPAPSMMSIHLKPTYLYQWDTQPTAFTLPANLIARHSSAGNEAIDPTGYRVEIAEEGAKQLRQREIHRSRLQEMTYAFVMRVNVIGSKGTSQILPHMAAAAFMGPLRGEERGGYEIMQAVSGSDWQIAQHNLQQIDVAHWGHTLAPSQQQKLRYTVGEREAAHMFRLPIPNHQGVPGMATLEGRSMPPPIGMPEEGTTLGMSTARTANAMPIRVVIGDVDRRRHLYVVGKTGTGKSTLLSSIVLQDIAAGKGVCLLDPHGDLIEDVITRIPAYRKDDVLLIDPSDELFPVGLNILNPNGEVDRARIANYFIALLQRMYDPHNNGYTGPVFQSFVRNSLLAVMEVPGSTLADIYRILVNIENVKPFMPHITDPVVKKYWEEEIGRSSGYSGSWRSELVPYLISKFSRFVDDPVLRRILSQSRNAVDWFDAIQSRKIILLNMAKGKIGSETSQFLGLMILGEVLEAVFKRGGLPFEQRYDLSIVIDEVQNYSTPLLSTMISEGRKFGVSLTLANQFLHQLDNGLREAVFGNIGTLAAMRVGVDDASLLAREFYPVFGADDLANLPRFMAATKLLVNGMATRPFTMRTLLPTTPPDFALAEQIVTESRQRYGTPISQVEAEIRERFKN